MQVVSPSGRAVRWVRLLAAIVALTTTPVDAAAEALAAAQGAAVTVPWTAPTGRGVAIGLDNGVWTNQFASSLRLRIPFGTSWGMNLRGIAVQQVTDEPYRLAALGSVELFGCTPVYLNVLRIYGGGGPRVGSRLVGPDAGGLVVGAGGHAGLEAFVHPGMSFYFEVGGTGGARGQSGGTAIGGMSFYL